MAIDLSNYESGKKYEGAYEEDLKALQDRLSRLQSLHILHGARTLIVIEGWDAAGKGGAIKRMTARLDPRYYRVYPVSAPTAEEKDKHFLWRFWNKLPGSQEISIWDRSHYGRVLVERVEKFCSEAEWRRGYDEINEFESRQGEIGTKIIKLFFHVTQETQDKVLMERLGDPAKRWKVTAEDFRNRERRSEYMDALADMFKRTHTRWAPWTVIDGNNQKAARIAALNYVVESLEASVPQDFPDAQPEIAALAEKTFGYSAIG
ncbi:polyphosphate kinase 2 family protein [Sphingorhabdus sp.]|jgi:polyphosphate kinase 2 (PPK2 family)|uniref:polyphosphate kinase 2 family protein n=1 Tax=Sphingorhabdus sp. TaxID=1902408 RepID=UPI0037C5AF49